MTEGGLTILIFKDNGTIIRSNRGGDAMNIALVTENFRYKVGLVDHFLLPNQHYPILQDEYKVLANDEIFSYVDILVNEERVSVPISYVVVLSELYVPHYRTMIEKYYEENKDRTENYTEAYSVGMGIERNTFPDINFTDEYDLDNL